MVRKEMWTYLPAYNLIRQTMLQSARASGLQPRQLSFTAALQAIAASWLVMVLSEHRIAERLIEAALAGLREHIVGNHPGRVEPRAIKRRPKAHHLLTKPRHQVHAEPIGEKTP